MSYKTIGCCIEGMHDALDGREQGHGLRWQLWDIWVLSPGNHDIREPHLDIDDGASDAACAVDNLQLVKLSRQHNDELTKNIYKLNVG